MPSSYRGRFGCGVSSEVGLSSAAFSVSMHRCQNGLSLPQNRLHVQTRRNIESVVLNPRAQRFRRGKMRWKWIDLNFPWIGYVGAIVLLALLFSTDVLRSDLDRSRWRDRVWLSWLGVAIYLIHNIEEYGVDLLGRFHAFPNSMCSQLGLPSFPACPIPTVFFLAVNLPLFWVGAPIAAFLSRRHPIVGLSVYGIIFINALTHIGSAVHAGYNPGMLTSLILFLPSSFWVARVSFGKQGLPYGALAFIVADGLLLHVVLMGSAMLFLHGVIGPSTVTVIQLLNALMFFLIASLAEKVGNGRFVRCSVAYRSS